MSEEPEIRIFAALDYIRDQAPAYAKSKAERVYIEGFLKSKKALLMKGAEKTYTAAAAQEREAYAHDEYIELLEGLRAAVEAEETLRWRLTAAQARIEVWRSLSANQRAEAKNI